MRLLDFSQDTPSQLASSTEICRTDPLNEKLTPRNFSQKLVPKAYSLNKFGLNKIARYKYEGKITKNRLKAFLTRIEQKQQAQYYECSLNYQENFSYILTGIK